MMVLFLGGPWHNERHDVTPGRLASAARSLPTHFTVPVPLVADAADVTISSSVGLVPAPRAPGRRGHVTYTRRYARTGGERLPVYVSPEYQGPARA